MSIASPAPPIAGARAASRPRTGRQWRLAVLLAILAAGAGILLTSISVWFLGAVALAGLGPAALAFNFHTPAAFVRLFALLRILGKYGERIVGHRAALLDQVTRRARLFATMAGSATTRSAGWQFGNQDRLSDYVDDVEDLDYARLRVAMPAIVLMTATATLAVATVWLAPLALLSIIPVAIILTVVSARSSARLAGHWRLVRSASRSAGRLLGTAFAAVVPLKAERAFSSVLAQAFMCFRTADTSRLAHARALALLDMLCGLIGPVAALSVLAAAWHAGSRGGALLAPALVAFGWLALGETALSTSRIILGRVRKQAARTSLAEWTTTKELQTSAVPAAVTTLQALTLANVPRLSPDGRRIGDAVNFTFRAGQPTALVGASGTGKTTLLKQIAGWIGSDESGCFTADGAALSSATRRALAHLCLHDTAIMSDTIRENLFAPDAPDADCWRALKTVELGGRVEAAGGLDAWISQERLSQGEAQRLNLARALLNRTPIVLLDEPVEHLDSQHAARILRRVLSHLADRIVIYSTHQVHTPEHCISL